MTHPTHEREAVCANCNGRGWTLDYSGGQSEPECLACNGTGVTPTPPKEPYYRAIHDPRCAFRQAGSPHPCTCAEFADAPRSLTHEEQQAHTAIISETARPVATTGGAAATAPDPAGAAGEEDKYVRAAREFDREDMRKLGEWIQANLQRHAGLSWSVAVAREVEELRARLAESERERAAVMQALGVEYDEDERTYAVLGKLAAVECDTLVEAAKYAVEIPSAAWHRCAALTSPEPT